MNNDINDRALLLLDKVSLSELAETNSKNYVRWQNIKRGSAKIRADEIEKLAKVFPQYAFWLVTDKIAPEIGQTSPEFEEAQEKLGKLGKPSAV